jgi:hypothetical protein
MKTYKTPAVVAKGGVVEITQGGILGTNDTSGETGHMPFGSVGFGL